MSPEPMTVVHQPKKFFEIERLHPVVGRGWEIDLFYRRLTLTLRDPIEREINIRLIINPVLSLLEISLIFFKVGIMINYRCRLTNFVNRFLHKLDPGGKR